MEGVVVGNAAERGAWVFVVGSAAEVEGVVQDGYISAPVSVYQGSGVRQDSAGDLVESDVEAAAPLRIVAPQVFRSHFLVSAVVIAGLAHEAGAVTEDRHDVLVQE